MNEKSCKTNLKQILESTELKPLLDYLEKFSGEHADHSRSSAFSGTIFPLQMKAVHDLCPVLLGCGSINYQRYATIYLEQLKDLKKMPELHLSFMKGYFVVKRTE